MVDGAAKRGLPELIQELLGHETTRPGRASEMKIDTLSDPIFLNRQDVLFGIRPFPLVHIEWKEGWVFSVLEGTASSPKKVLVTYQKENGTGYIQRLCGQFELTQAPDGLVHIRIYEEAAAKGRSEQDTLSGITTTLRKLQSHYPSP